MSEWLIRKNSCKGMFISEILGCTYFKFLTQRHVKEERLFINIFLSEGLGENCEHRISFKFHSKTIF